MPERSRAGRRLTAVFQLHGLCYRPTMMAPHAYPILIAAFALQAAPAQAPPPEWAQGDWAPLAREGAVRVDFDASGLRRDGDKVRVRIRADLPDAPGGVRWGLMEFELDCRAGSWRQLATREYGTDGALLRRSDEAASAGSPPSTAKGRANIDLVCRRAGWRGDAAEDGTAR